MDIVKGFNPKTIAGAKQLPVRLVPNCKGPHPYEPIHALSTPFFVGCQNNLRIRFRPKRVALLHQLNFDFEIIVDFPVVHDDEIAKLHWLVRVIT